MRKGAFNEIRQKDVVELQSFCPVNAQDVYSFPREWLNLAPLLFLLDHPVDVLEKSAYAIVSFGCRNQLLQLLAPAFPAAIPLFCPLFQVIPQLAVFAYELQRLGRSGHEAQAASISVIVFKALR